MTAITIQKTTNIVNNILESADCRFKKYGYKKTTVNEIVADVKISKKTLYAVFPAKEDILNETSWREMVEIIRSFNDTVPANMMTDSLLLALCKYIFTDRIKKGKEGLFWGIYSEDSEIQSAYVKSLKRVITAIYEDGSKRGLFRQINPLFASEMIANCIITATGYFHLSGEPVRMFDSALSMIAGAVLFKERIAFDTMGR